MNLSSNRLSDMSQHLVSCGATVYFVDFSKLKHIDQQQG